MSIKKILLIILFSFFSSVLNADEKPLKINKKILEIINKKFKKNF